MYFRFASYWNVPVFTTAGMEETFRSKTSEYSSLTCLGGDYDQFARCQQSLTRFAVNRDKPEPL